MKDKYDREIQRLNDQIKKPDPGKDPKRWAIHVVGLSWCKAEPLFAVATKSGYRDTGDDHECGCLTEIRQSSYGVQGRPDLAARIKADLRLPKSVDRIRPKHLPIFAEWQRILDRELGRVV